MKFNRPNLIRFANSLYTDDSNYVTLCAGEMTHNKKHCASGALQVKFLGKVKHQLPSTAAASLCKLSGITDKLHIHKLHMALYDMIAVNDRYCFEYAVRARKVRDYLIKHVAPLLSSK